MYTKYSPQTQEKALYPPNMFARYAQSRRTSYSDVESLVPYPNYHHHYLSKPS
jgi:hypothetical protein